MIKSSIKFSLVAALLLTIANSAFSAEVICAREAGKKLFYPQNKLALEIATSLDVKTCKGDRFKALVKSKGHTGKIVVVKAATMKVLKAKLKEAALPTTF